MPALEALFEPRAVAVVGASRTAGKLGHDVMVECARLGYAGRLVGVTPSADGWDVAGRPVVRSLTDLDEPVDLAFVAVSADSTLAAVRDCAAAGVRAAVLAAAGLGELGGAHALLESEIGQVAAETGMRLLGPNGFGLYVRALGLN